MKVEFKVITESDFNKMDSELIFNTERPRCHGIIFNKEISFKFAWQSDLIIPEINEISENVYCLGIDLNFAIIDFKSNLIISNLLLDHFFYGSKVYEDFLYVITELSIIKIELVTFRLIETFHLPDIFKGIVFGKNIVEVKCWNDEIVYFNI
ncbi:hypothetical protein GR160_07415 [Flavobacterium sp. Sd200]|uniref:hypothetical protein n=1 Tax=Flavobacterium sp. Sd200 TaxID=2692211 RepID=UPI00136ECEAB|nr:hypothetical protein [Flavobacterium sp. Sd200]MXN91055.1 hypothetical protein [Flavobacterium sp. Sd200]